jgi:RNA polymerase sigma-70 factor (ECF subfamily)
LAHLTSFEKVKNGDRTAFEKLFREYYEGVHRFIWGYVQSKAVAKELAQDVFLSIWENREQITIQESVKAYLFRAARNKSIDWLRHKKVERKWEEEEKTHLENKNTPDPSKRLHDKRMLKEVKKAIQNFPQRRREVFMLSRYEEMTYKEIAELLDISQSTVETHMSRALSTLREQFLPLLTLLAMAVTVY